jgi:hypothetical protein
MPTLVDCQIWLFGVNGAIHKSVTNWFSRFSVGLISTLLAPKARTKTESSVLFRTGPQNEAALVVLSSISHAVGAECYSSEISRRSGTASGGGVANERS